MISAADDVREHLKRTLSVHLANLETLAQEAREIVAAGAKGLDLFRLCDNARAAEQTLRWGVEAAALESGLLAIQVDAAVL